MALNYNKLIGLNPTVFGEMTNSKGQLITFVEDPINGDEASIICVCHELQLVARSGFYELDDMTADHKEYEPSFEDGKFYIGCFEENN